MRCDTCKQESALVKRVVIDKDYNRALARPLYNCPMCFEKKEQSKKRAGLGVQGSALSPEPKTKGEESHTE